jgi:hypothetical protein
MTKDEFESMRGILRSRLAMIAHETSLAEQTVAELFPIGTRVQGQTEYGNRVSGTVVENFMLRKYDTVAVEIENAAGQLMGSVVYLKALALEIRQ